LMWPSSEPAQRMVLLSAAPMAMAASILAAAASSSVGWSRWRLVVGLAAGLAFGLAPLPWSQAVITEVHGLNALFVALAVVLIASLSGFRRSGWEEAALALGAGIGLGNHLTFLLMAPPLALALAARWRSGERRRVAKIAFAFASGAVVYALLPLLARSHPPVNWGDASTANGLWWLVSGGPYRGMVFGLPPAEIPPRVGAGAKLLLDQLGFVGLGLLGVGLAAGRSRWTWVDRTTLWMAASYAVFALAYNAADSFVYLIPAWMGMTWWMMLGLERLLSLADVRGRTVPAAMLGVTAVLAAVRVPAIVRQVDARKDVRAMAYTERVLTQAPPGAFVLTSTDQDTFPLWYSHFAQGQRPDLRLVVVPLAQYDWYRENLMWTYPDLDLPSPEAADVWVWKDQLLDRNARPVCGTRITGEGVALDVELSCEN
ncbi:MAG TPA: DUF2723 domain-containing protein, partial [Anaerolineales bacterium]|nr:DUF2723 domain-containing protein [Anaerolineales bacterium]